MKKVIYLHDMYQFKVPGRACYTTALRWLPYTIKCHVMGLKRRLEEPTDGGPIQF